MIENQRTSFLSTIRTMYYSDNAPYSSNCESGFSYTITIKVEAAFCLSYCTLSHICVPYEYPKEYHSLCSGINLLDDKVIYINLEVTTDVKD